METIGNLDHMTGGMLYLSITHLQREDTLQVFGCVGHIRPALWPRGCYCRHKGTEASAFYAKHTDFLHFYDAVHVPPFPCRLSVCHIGHCTHWAGSHFLESDSRLQLRSCACSIFPAHRPSHWREGAHKRTLPPVPLSQDGFSEEAMLFVKSISELSPKGSVLLYFYDTAGGPKSK